MIRTFLTTLLLISITIGGMLFWQWNLFSGSKGLDTQAEKRAIAYQRIEMKQSDKNLSVIHKIDGLQEQSYIVENPNNLDFTCTYDEKTECIWDKQNHLLIPEKQEQVIFKYNFAAPKVDKSTLYNRVFLGLKGVQFENSRVEIISTVSEPGYWISSAPLIGETKKDYIQYSVFEQPGNMFPIYHTPVEMDLQNENHLSIYHEKGIQQDSKKIDATLSVLPNYKKLTLIVSKTHKEFLSDNFVISSDISNPERLLQQLFTLELQSQYHFENIDEKWMMDVIGNLKYNRKFGGEKPQKMADSIRAGLEEDELKIFLKDIDNSQLLTAKLLDNFLTKAKGKESQFFKDNRIAKAEFSPLLFIDQRSLQVNGKGTNEKMILLQNQSLYPLHQVMNNLGYEYHPIDQNQILVSKEGLLIRFYLNKNVFIVNGDDYGVKTNPLKAVNGDIYISEEWLQDIFKVNIYKQETAIEINSL